VTFRQWRGRGQNEYMAVADLDKFYYCGYKSRQIN